MPRCTHAVGAQHAAPLPLPEKLDLRGAQRFDVALGAPDAAWTRPANFSTSSAPTFRAKAGRTDGKLNDWWQYVVDFNRYAESR